MEYNDEVSFKIKFRKRCFDFSLRVLTLSKEFSSTHYNRILLDQLLRSATSIGANVVEGGSSISKKEFISYFQVSLKSASESIYWLELLAEMNKSISSEIEPLIEECMEIKKLLSTILIKTKSQIQS